MSERCDYVAQLSETSALVARSNAVNSYDLVYQSRSGPPTQPWLVPELCQHLRQLYAQGVKQVVVSPLGFVAEHMEVVWDLDIEAATCARELGIDFVRAKTVGRHPDFVAMVRELVHERSRSVTPRTTGKQ